MNSEHRLDFAVIGAQKCATSWMYYCLNDHPDICMSRKKRESTYVGGPLFQANGEAWFFDRFSRGGETVMGDISVDYLYDGASASAIKRYMPQPKLVMSLRNPIDRFVSSYFWLCRSSILPNLDINDWIKQLPESVTDWREAIGEQPAQVVLRGFYATQFAAWSSVFPPESFLVLLYEQIRAEPLVNVQRVYDFLGVDSEFVPKSLSSRPKKNSYNTLLVFVERTFRSRLTAHVVNVAHQRLSRFINREAPVSSSSRSKLEKIFVPEMECFLELLGEVPAGSRPDIAAIRDEWGLR